MQLLPRNIYRRNTFQISRNTDNIPSSKLDQGLFAAKNIHQRNTGIDWYSLGHDSQSTARDYGRGNLGKEKMLREEGYKPRILAVDEFVIHKGHSYATCVMDLEQGDILWLVKGRAMKNFEKFFEDVPSDSLSAVIAVAMDMNASYNKLVTKHGLYMIGFICSRNLAEMFSALFVWMKLAGIKPKKKKSLPISRMIPTRKL